MAVKWSGEQTCSLLLQISGKNNGQNFKRADSYTVRDPPFVRMGEFSGGENFVCKRVGSSALVVPKGELWGLGACSTRRPFFFFSGLTTAHAAHRTWEKVNCEGPGASKLCFPDNKNLLGWLVASAGSVASEEGEPGKLGFTRAPGDSYHHGSWKNTFAKHHSIHLMDSTGVLRRQMRN